MKDGLYKAIAEKRLLDYLRGKYKHDFKSKAERDEFLIYKSLTSYNIRKGK